HPVAECNHCNHQLSGQAQRLHAYLNSCQKYQNFLNSNQNESTTFDSLSVTNTQKNPILPIDSYLLRLLTLIKKKSINKKIARTFYASSIPYALIENSFVILALKSLHPSYNPPS
ncbi:42715_t:CDS:1, partial [Gigaspora margarita]